MGPDGCPEIGGLGADKLCLLSKGGCVVLCQTAKAADHLRQAMDNSPDPRSQAVYATKLDHLLDRFRASRLQ